MQMPIIAGHDRRTNTKPTSLQVQAGSSEKRILLMLQVPLNEIKVAIARWKEEKQTS